eukprot:GHUV01010143.1.p1 GENE.GHUV01010143.1~~GHUV01010143.1.p1  ORF type:complete len:543 (+),score=81.34 GHUV01010143.1:1340-2968(+)
MLCASWCLPFLRDPSERKANSSIPGSLDCCPAGGNNSLLGQPSVVDDTIEMPFALVRPWAVADTDMAQLPADAVAQVLSHVEQRQRLAACALVCRLWHQAARRTVKRINCKPQKLKTFSSLSAWLTSSNSHHSLLSITVDGSQCTVSAQAIRVMASGSPVKVLRLPFYGLGSLQSLCLRDCIVSPFVKPGASSQQLAAGLHTLSALAALTSLELAMCQVDLSGLGSCSRLQHLRLARAADSTAYRPTWQADTAADRQLWGALATALPQLQSLSHLTLQGVLSKEITTPQLQAIRQGLSALPQLVELRLQASPTRFDSGVACLAYIPTSLTMLELDRMFGTRMLTLGTAPGLPQLVNLRQLQINMVHTFHPALLWSLSMLQLLHLEDAPIRGTTATSEFLFVLSELTQLQHLHLDNILDKDSMLDVARPYASLTASSRLTYLFLDRLYLPKDTASHIFAAGRPCHNLVEAGMEDYDLQRRSDMEQLVRCCPNLRRLHVLRAPGACGGIDPEVWCNVQRWRHRGTCGGGDHQHACIRTCVKHER